MFFIYGDISLDSFNISGGSGVAFRRRRARRIARLQTATPTPSAKAWAMS